MAIDWNAFSDANRMGRTGRASEALQQFISLEPLCESDRDRAVLSLGQSMCWAHLGRMAEALAQVERAKQFATGERDLMLQIEVAEANCRALNSEPQTACDLYERIAATYRDLLNEDLESAEELDKRHGYALVHVERYEEAVSILSRLLRSSRLEDEQRVRLYLGSALDALGESGQARIEFELAAKGPNTELAKDALDRLSTADEVH